MEGRDVPDLVPVRMLNEFTYCRRLFHLEWVQTEWADSVDTDEGTWQHRVVDRQQGAAPEAEAVDELRRTTSLQLSSPRLGLVGKIDVLETGEDGAVVPVDYKRGRPPENDERAWLPERVQLAAHGLLLVDNGYKVDHGVLYFAESKQRIEVPFDQALLDEAAQLLAELRKVAARAEPPPPLVDSPKCPRCSLVGICLPDEINFIGREPAAENNADDDAPRRLIASRPAARPVYVTEQGARVSKSKGRLIVKDEQLVSVRLIDVSELCLFGNIQISSQALRELFKREIPTLWFSYGGWFSGIAHGMPSKNVTLRLGQAQTATDGRLPIATAMVSAKVLNARKLLMRNARERPEAEIGELKTLANKAAQAHTVERLLGIEGAAARTYFSVFDRMLTQHSLPGEPFAFDGRNRRPPRDPINCLLSMCYSLLAKDCTTTALAVGFDPYLGVFHKPRFGRPALALDLMEEFRPLIADSVVLTCVNRGEVKPSDFVVRARGVSLTTGGRRAVIAAHERRMNQEVQHPVFGYRASYRRVLEIQARLLAATMKGEVDAYTGMVTR